jgi:5-methyltetrahydrofolate--homocysteine methyltransferase
MRKNFSSRIVAEKLLTARGVFGFWPANSLGDDVEIYRDESRTEVMARFYFLRQQMLTPAGQPNYCLPTSSHRLIRDDVTISALLPSPPGLERTNWRTDSRPNMTITTRS